MPTTLFPESGHDTKLNLIEIARGAIYGAESFGGYGEKVTAGADSGLVWPDGVFTYPPTAGTQVSVVSSSASDGVAGTGIRSIDIHYLDSTLVPRIETVVLNGTTPVLTVATNIRFIQCMHMVTFGSGKAAAGVILASNGAGANYSQITTGFVRCSSSLRMVPAGKRLLLTSMFGGSVSGTAAAKVIIRIATPSFDGHDFTQNSVFIPLFSATYQDSSSGLSIPCPLTFTEGQSVGMVFEGDKAATVVASWFGVLEDM